VDQLLRIDVEPSSSHLASLKPKVLAVLEGLQDVFAE
jgi:hypothetical protein